MLALLAGQIKSKFPRKQLRRSSLQNNCCTAWYTHANEIINTLRETTTARWWCTRHGERRHLASRNDQFSTRFHALHREVSSSVCGGVVSLVFFHFPCPVQGQTTNAKVWFVSTVPRVNEHLILKKVREIQLPRLVKIKRYMSGHRKFCDVGPWSCEDQ